MSASPTGPPAPPAGDDRRDSHPPVKVPAASLIGTAIEWYDFYLYATATALVFNVIFFPSADPLMGVVAAFATYSVGFVFRPLGGVIAGHLGDILGRRSMLVATLFLMGTATTLIGVLPTYDQVGILAPVLLAGLRILQGVAVGGEWGGATLIAVEHAPARKRGLYGSFSQVGFSVGTLLATGTVFGVRALMSPEDFIAWGWRLPFLASAALVVIGVVIRLKIQDAAVFRDAKKNNALSQRPVRDVLRSHPRTIVLAIGMRLAQNSVGTLYITFALSYLQQRLGPETSVGLAGVMILSAASLISTPMWATLSDRFGRKRMYLIGAIGSFITLPAFFLAAESGSRILIVISMVVGYAAFHDAMFGPQAAWFAELFETSVRYSGVSIGYQVGSTLGGGLAPLIATALLIPTGGSPVLVMVYVAVLTGLSVAAALAAPETYRLPDLTEHNRPAATVTSARV